MGKTARMARRQRLSHLRDGRTAPRRGSGARIQDLEVGKVALRLSATEFPARSQDLALALYDAAQFYRGSVQTWIDKAMIFNEFSAQILIPKARPVDIDSLEDGELAESLLQLPRR
jgi:CMP-N-acetylneuraminic acid synthetase